MSVAKRRIEEQLAAPPPADYFTDVGAIGCPHCGALFYPGDEITMARHGEHLVVLVCDCGDRALLSDDRDLPPEDVDERDRPLPEEEPGYNDPR